MKGVHGKCKLETHASCSVCKKPGSIKGDVRKNYPLRNGRKCFFLTSPFIEPGARFIRRTAGQRTIGGAGVASDHLPTKTRKMVTRSSGSSAAITGEPGRLAPQLFAALPGTKNIRCGCQLISLSLRYCCFDIM